MISAPDREETIRLVNEAAGAGASIPKACREVGIAERTYYRWCKQRGTAEGCKDLRPSAAHPEPRNKLSAEERKKIVDTVNRPDFASFPPCEIVPALADQGKYIASESTFYRVLHEEKMQNRRGRAAEPQHRPVSTHVATAPNMVWIWDYPDDYVIPTFFAYDRMYAQSIEKISG